MCVRSGRVWIRQEMEMVKGEMKRPCDLCFENQSAHDIKAPSSMVMELSRFKFLHSYISEDWIYNDIILYLLYITSNHVKGVVDQP